MKSPQFRKYSHMGIVTDLPPEQVPATAWTGGQNVEFVNLTTSRIKGYQAFGGTPSVAPLFCMYYLKSGLPNWIYCGTNQVFTTDGLTHTEITPAGGLSSVVAGAWTGCILNGVPVLNNGVDEPMYYDLNTVLLPLPGWPANSSCKAIRAFKYHLFALNITTGANKYPDSLWWSNGATPGTIPQEWTPTVENDAGDMVLSDTVGHIVDGLAMRDSFVVYKDTSTYSLNYVAGQYVYTQRKNFLNAGLQSNNCIVEVDGYHWVFTGTDLIRHDCQTSQSMVANRVRRLLTNSVDPARLTECCMVHKVNTNQIWCCIPEVNKGALSKAFIFNTETLDIGIRDLPNVAFVGRGVVKPNTNFETWDSDAQSWDSDPTFWGEAYYSPQDDSFMMADFDSTKLWSVDTIETEDGANVFAGIERLSMPVETEDFVSRRMITRIIPRISGEAGDVLNFRVGSQVFSSDPISWGVPFPYVIGQSIAVPCQVEGRYLSLNVSGTTTRAWQFHQYALEFVDLGLY